MDDHGLAELSAELEVAPQVAQLIVSRRESAVVIEPRLTNRDDHRVARELDDCQKVSVAIARVVRMNARARVNVGARGELECRARRGQIPARDEDAFDAAGARLLQDRIAVGFERLGLYVAV